MSFVNNLFVNNNATIAGNLDVRGTTTAVNSENLNIKDRHIYINNDYTSTTALTGGMVINYLPTAVSTTVSVGGFTATNSVNVVGNVFVVGDVVQITLPTSNTTNVANTGIFEVLSNLGGVMTIYPTSDFAQTAFVFDTTEGAIITKVNIAIMQVSTSGKWQSVIGENSSTFETKDVLLSGDDLSEGSITLTDETDQIKLGTVGVVTLTAPTDDNSTITFPDTLGVDDTIVYEILEQTLSNKTLTLPKINDTSADHTYTFAVSELTDNRTVTLPLLVSDDTFVFEDHAQTLSNKTLASPTVTGQILNDDGLVSAPSYSFTSNTDTGMYTDGTTLNLVFDGVDVLKINQGTLSFGPDIDITIPNVIEGVKNYITAGTHDLSVDGERVNIFTFVGTKIVNLDDAPTSGTKYTLINGETGALTINRTGTDTIDDGILTFLILSEKYQRVTLQYVLGNWYIV